MKKSLFFLLALVMVFSFTLGAAANPVKDNRIRPSGPGTCISLSRI